ncbi:MAG: TIGR03960 family B12-binding radical SAM protein [Clostridiales bacterium]|nr:TIGR03960 family B12-binding radical SAM protein [Clostridiales bacterium]
MQVQLTDEILRKVQKATRYTGGEWNSVIKDRKDVKATFAFCFPDVYDIGMSHLGLRILYDVLNKNKDIYCERVFAPWTDMEDVMREKNIPLFSLETRTPISEFDVVGFTLQYEMCYTNVLNMLDLGNIPLRSADRTDTDPIVCAGGPCTCNVEPMSAFFDFAMMGEGEELILEVMQVIIEEKDKKESNYRVRVLERLAELEGVYVPSIHTEDKKKAGLKIKKRIIKDMDKVEYPENPIVPYGDIVHDRAVLELFRGCIRGCRFCQAGFLYRPVREKSVDRLVELAKKNLASSGYKEISLSSLSTSDYTCFNELADKLIDFTKEEKVNLSLPSLRIDSVNLDLLDRAQSVRKSGITLAPEAGTQRLRNVINKGLTEEDILNGVSLAFKAGWNNVKLYFMMGLPTETYEDLDGIADLANKILDEYYKIPKNERASGINITVSASVFVPKPFTPFQWVRQNTKEEVIEKQKYLREKLNKKHITFNYHYSDISLLEAVFARGDDKLCDVIETAFRKGCKFDGWGEYYSHEKWLQAFNECNIKPEDYAYRDRDLDEYLPWEFLDIGIRKEFFKSEWEKALREEVTPNCRVKCAGCGIKECEERGKHS